MQRSSRCSSHCARCLKWESLKAAHPQRCHSRCDSYDPSDLQMYADLSASLCVGHCAAGQCCFPAGAEACCSSAERISSSFGAVLNPALAVRLVAAAAGEPASAAGEPAPDSAAPDPAAGHPAGLTCFCDDAGGADVLATVPGCWPGLTPARAGVSSVLLSCVHFLALCSGLHHFSCFSSSISGALKFSP